MGKLQVAAVEAHDGILKERGEITFIDAFASGYYFAKKDTIEKAVKWLHDNWREYIMGPDSDGMIGFGHWEYDFKKAMEKE